MSQIRTAVPRPLFLRRLLVWVMLAVIVTSLATWYATRDRLPAEIRLATGLPGGLYHKVGQILSDYLSRRTGRPVRLIQTQGSQENIELLSSGEADLAVLQAGSVSMDEIAMLAPLYHEPIFIIARRNTGISSPHHLAGHAVAIGPVGSGMRESARVVLDHYGAPLESLSKPDRYFTELLKDKSLDAAVVTTGPENPDLRQVLGSGAFELIALEDAEAIALRHPFLRDSSIPRGLFAAAPPLPPQRLPTVATTAILAGRKDTSKLLIQHTLAALYEDPVAQRLPGLIGRKLATEAPLLGLHPEALEYHDPYGGIGILASFMESMAAIKELLFALGAGLFLLWERWRRLKERERQKEFELQKERLDALLMETVVIEKAQMNINDGPRLKNFLDEVTSIKLRALEELTHEDLRGDQFFAIFLAQCSNLIRKLQSKMLLAESPHHAQHGHASGDEADFSVVARKPKDGSVVP